MTRAVGSGVDALLERLVPLLRAPLSSVERDAVLAALNGVLGDHLAAIGSPLALTMELRRAGPPLAAPSGASRETQDDATGRLLLFVHGLCMNERAWDDPARPAASRWDALARDLGATGLRVRYDSGLHVSTNGRRLAELVETLFQQWPCAVEELSVVSHSMGGLVVRSACHYGEAAGHAWPRRLRNLVFLGTPHHGAPLERIGNLAGLALAATPWSAPFARLGRIRSAGITDLRFGSLLDEEWEGRDRFAHAGDSRSVVPLPAGVRCFAVAASAAKRRGPFTERLLGDGLVPVKSALGHHAEPGRSLALPDSRTRIFPGMRHLELLTRPEVAEQVRTWLNG